MNNATIHASRLLSYGGWLTRLFSSTLLLNYACGFLHASEDGRELFRSYIADLGQQRAEANFNINEFRKKWLLLFSRRLGEMKKEDQGYLQLKSEAMALSAALGQLEQAVALNRELIALAQGGDARLKAEWKMNLGQLCSILARKDRTNPLLNEQAVLANEDALKTIADCPDPATKLDFLNSYRLFIKSSPERFLELSEACLSILNSVMADTTTAPPNKVKAFKREGFLGDQLNVYCKLNKPDKAREVVGRLQQLPEGLVNNLSSYVNQYAMLVASANSKKYRDVLLSFEFQAVSIDSLRRQELLGNSYFSEGNFGAAEKAFKEGLSNKIFDLQSSDTHLANLSANVLEGAARALEAQGKKDQSLSLRRILNTRFPARNKGYQL